MLTTHAPPLVPFTQRRFTTPRSDQTSGPELALQPHLRGASTDLIPHPEKPRVRLASHGAPHVDAVALPWAEGAEDRVSGVLGRLMERRRQPARLGDDVVIDQDLAVGSKRQDVCHGVVTPTEDRVGGTGRRRSSATAARSATAG